MPPTSSEIIIIITMKLVPESARSAADKMLLEQYKVATLDYSYVVPNFPQGYGRLATSFPRSPLLLVYEMILETRVRVNISTSRG